MLLISQSNKISKAIGTHPIAATWLAILAQLALPVALTHMLARYFAKWATKLGIADCQ